LVNIAQNPKNCDILDSSVNEQFYKNLNSKKNFPMPFSFCLPFIIIYPF